MEVFKYLCLVVDARLPSSLEGLKTITISLTTVPAMSSAV